MLFSVVSKIEFKDETFEAEAEIMFEIPNKVNRKRFSLSFAKIRQKNYEVFISHDQNSLIFCTISKCYYATGLLWQTERNMKSKSGKREGFIIETFSLLARILCKFFISITTMFDC